MIQQYPSQLFSKAVSELSGLPGIGQKTALRLALFILKQDEDKVERFVNTISAMRKEIRHCKICHNISDTEICPICSNTHRDKETVCVVENVQDVIAVENTQQFNGLYHVLGGVISPMDGIGADDIRIKELLKRLTDESVKEVIIALNPSVEGEATSLYLTKLIKPFGVKISRIAFGLPVGADLEYADEITIAKAIEGRREI